MNRATNNQGAALPNLGERFKCLKKLGQGGLATVWLARDTHLDRDIAIKLVHKHLASENGIYERFQHELAINRLIQHPGIVEYYEIFTYNDQLFLSMEYMGGGDLKSRIIDQRQLPVKMCIDIAGELLDALAHAHKKGVIHGDIKPQNILFTIEGKPKISDFSLARLSSAEHLVSDSMDAGTPDYSPPELIEGLLCDARADIYSFGISLYECICGRTPFIGNSALAVLHAHIEQKPPLPSALHSDIPLKLEAIILKAIEKNPLDRFQSAALFREAVDAVLPVNGNSAGSAKQQEEREGSTLHCKSCGRRVSVLLGYCFECNEDSIRLCKAVNSKTSSRVLITGPGATSSKLNPRARQKLVKLMDASGAETHILKKKIPRLPFVLIKNLDSVSARQLEDEINKSGLMAVSGSRKEKSKKFLHARKSFVKKNRTMALRSLLIVLGFSGGMWSSISNSLISTRAFSGSLGFFIPLLLIVLGAAIIPAIFVSSRAVTKIGDNKKSSSLEEETKRILMPIKSSLKTSALKSLAATICLKLDRVLDEGLLEKDKTLAEDFLTELDAWVKLALATESISSYLQSRPESAILAKLKQADNRELTDELKKRRELENSYNSFIDLMLSFNTKLDALRLSQASALEATLTRGSIDMRKSLKEAREIMGSDHASTI